MGWIRCWFLYVNSTRSLSELTRVCVQAGLFSAVVSTLLVQATQNLQVNYTEVTASLMFELVQIQRAVAVGTSVTAVPTSLLNPTTKVKPDNLNVWTNGLWGISLSLSLSVALATVLVKQWLHRYLAVHSGTPRDRSHTRQFRYTGFEKWQVLNIIGVLPVIMHISLAFFLVGLVLFLAPLQRALSYVIGVITGILYTLYLITNTLPIIYPQCPYQTPVSDLILAFHTCLQRYIQTILIFMDYGSSPTVKGLITLKSSLRDLEKEAVKQAYHSLSLGALHHLHKVSTNLSVHNIIIQAFGGLLVNFKHGNIQNLFLNSGIADFEQWRMGLDQTLFQSLISQEDNIAKLQLGLEPRLERFCRAFLVLQIPVFVPQSINLYSGSTSNLLSLATALASSRASTPHKSYIEFILTFHTENLHPVIWTTIVQNAFYSDITLIYSDIHIFRVIFRALWGRSENRQIALPDTMNITIQKFMRDEFCERILRRIGKARLVEGGAGTHVHALISTLEFLWGFVSALKPASLSTNQPQTGRTQAYEKIIYYILQQFQDEFYHHSFNHLSSGEQWPIMKYFLSIFTTQIIEKTDLSFLHTHQESIRVHIIAYYKTALEMYLRTRPLFGHNPLVIKTFDSLQPSIKHILRSLPKGPNQLKVVAYNPEMNKLYYLIYEILALAIMQGSETALQLVVIFDCLDQQSLWNHDASTEQGGDNKYSVILCLLAGLTSNSLSIKSDTFMRELCIDYLYKPSNLHYAVVSLIFTTKLHSFQVDSKSLLELMKLCPSKVVWNQCQNWLQAVLDWVQQGCQEQDFMDQQLGEKKMQVYITNHLAYLRKQDDRQKIYTPRVEGFIDDRFWTKVSEDLNLILFLFLHNFNHSG